MDERTIEARALLQANKIDIYYDKSKRERSSTMDGGQRNWRGEDRQKLQKN
jgi:hypothetical protein